MSDQTACPFCNSPVASWNKYHVAFVCGTKTDDEEFEEFEQSDACRMKEDRDDENERRD